MFLNVPQLRAQIVDLFRHALEVGVVFGERIEAAVYVGEFDMQRSKTGFVLDSERV